MLAPLSLTIISSFQTARYNNQALSMNPFGLHLPGRAPPVEPSVQSVVLDGTYRTVNDSDKYINKANHYKNMQTDENERGEYINTKKWKLLNINRKTDARGRIHVNEVNYENEIKVFVSDSEQDLESCKHYVLLPHSIYTEIRKSRAKDQIGAPLKVQKNGDVWTTQKDKYVKIFVKVE